MARSTKTVHRTRLKAQIVLMAADGSATRAIGRALGCTTGTAPKWRVRYAKDRLAGFSKVGEGGAAPKYGEATDRRILALLDAPPPEGYANWTGPLPLIAEALAGVHVQYIWRFFARPKNRPFRTQVMVRQQRPAICVPPRSSDLYMAPPEDAILVAVDEKPSIQALKRAQADLKLPNGRASRTITNAMGRRRCSLPSTSPAARSSGAITSGGDASSSSTS